MKIKKKNLNEARITANKPVLHEARDWNAARDKVYNRAPKTLADFETLVPDEEQRNMLDELENIAAKLDASLVSMEDADEAELWSILNGLYREAVNSKKKAIANGGDYLPHNLLIEGMPGTGKTSVVRQWANAKKLNLVIVTGSDLTAASTRGIPVHVQVPTNEIDQKTGEPKLKDVQSLLATTMFDALDQRDEVTGKRVWSVLFVDEINRSSTEAEGALLTLVNNHTITDVNSKGGRKLFDSYLFTVAALNPPETESDLFVRPVSNAMNDRFFTHKQNGSMEDAAWHFIKQFQRELDIDDAYLAKYPDSSSTKRDISELQGKTDIVLQLREKHVLFSTPETAKKAAGKFGGIKGASGKSAEHIFSPRSLEYVLNACDGTVGVTPMSPAPVQIEAQTATGTSLSDMDFHFSKGSFMYWYVKHITTFDAESFLSVYKALYSMPIKNGSANSVKDTLIDKYRTWKDANQDKFK